MLRAPEHPDVKSNEEQGRAKSKEQGRDEAAAFLDGLGADLNAIFD